MSFDPAADAAAAGGAPLGPPPASAGEPPATPTAQPVVDETAGVEPEQAAAVEVDPLAEAHQAAADNVASAGPIVWGDRGERVLMAALLLARATGQSNAVAEGQVQPMWSSDLADQCKAFQAANSVSASLPGCVDQATWAALEAAAQGRAAA